MSLDGTNKTKLEIPEVSGTKKFPRLSPDGARLAFYQTSPGSKWYSDNVAYIYVLDLASQEVTKLNNASIPASCLSWSPDGSLIAFSTTTGVTPPIHELWTVKADGSEYPVRIADSGSPSTGACGYPAFIDNDNILCGSTKNKILNWRSDWDGSHYKYELAKIGPDGTGFTILLAGRSIKDPLWVPGASQ
jgi:dipeptidyl aminopeptidase/acylaminoacyl peptidase